MAPVFPWKTQADLYFWRSWKNPPKTRPKFQSKQRGHEISSRQKVPTLSSNKNAKTSGDLTIGITKNHNTYGIDANFSNRSILFLIWFSWCNFRKEKHIQRWPIYLHQKKHTNFRLFEAEWNESSGDTLPKTNMPGEKQPFEDVFPIEHGDFPASHVNFRGDTPKKNIWWMDIKHDGPCYKRQLLWVCHPLSIYFWGISSVYPPGPQDSNHKWRFRLGLPVA